MMKKMIFILALSLSFPLLAQETIDLFIWAGQSNALGRQGDAASYPNDPNNLDNQIRFNWNVPDGGNSGGWTTMQPQDLGNYFPDGHFGPEVTFSRKLLQAGYNPAIFKYTQGATSIFEHWLNPGDGGLYDNMVTALNTAITTLENQGHTVNVKGLIWIQGESDSNTDASANAYFNNLTLLLSDLRNNVINNPTLPVILGVDEQFFNLPGRERHQVLNAHQNIALNDNTVKFTSMYGYPKADDTHLTPAGLISHGESLFDSFQLLVSDVYPQENCTLSSVGNTDSFLRKAWGQSFTTDCSGILSTIKFEAITVLNNTATFSLYNSADCSGTVLATQTLASILDGDNTVDLSNLNIYLDKEHTYYFDIVSDTNSTWEINFSNIDNVFGVLRCTADDDITLNCGRTFLNFDMDFSVNLIDQSPTCTLDANGNIESYSRASWGQSFTTSCSGNLNTVRFYAHTPPNPTTSATFYLYDGLDCNSPLIYTKPLTEIVGGDNFVSINGITLNENHTYFFQVITDNDAFWTIDYSNTSVVDGMLHTYLNGSYCGRSFANFDINFSIEIAPSTSTCADSNNVYRFEYGGKTYDLIKENKTWLSAVDCAVERGGYLAEINDQAEQDAVFSEIINNANITLNNTVAVEGGGASYVWLGGNDLDANGQNNEGRWIWDGDNDGNSTQFWQGDTNGNPVNGLYSNWGTEPDNFNNIQDVLAIAITQWPINTGTLGTAGQWNDLDQTNTLYYLVEYSSILSTSSIDLNKLLIYPNPITNFVNIDALQPIKNVVVYNIQGQIIKTKKLSEDSKSLSIDFSNVQNGIYLIKTTFENGSTLIKKVIK